NELPISPGDVLSRWRGVDGLRADLRQLTNASPDSRVLLANRSQELMRLASQLMFGPCRNVLVTDLTWPAYLQTLHQYSGPPTNRITRVNLRELILSERISKEEVVQRLAEAFHANGCDGLFLPAVDNLGVLFPAMECVKAISSTGELRFVVVDGAQALGHVPVDLSENWCDLFLAGCHKWLRAQQPLGLGYFGSERTRRYIDSKLQRLIESNAIDDPLLTMTETLRSGRWASYTETVNLAPLFTCHGALQDICGDALRPGSLTNDSCHSLAELFQSTLKTNWRLISPNCSMKTQIVLMQSPVSDSSLPKETLRQQFLQHGIALTTYDGGLIRLSLPHSGFKANDQLRVVAACETT
ncbi:MAG TPA: aminotransferase class V-fold PLP-dependent enzyme, partial [Planctomycetaceae bacterium]|nr:aminotransferase class V-fold PLP-dependent enzyme [Planctomycetaceae bacterium]